MQTLRLPDLFAPEHENVLLNALAVGQLLRVHPNSVTRLSIPVAEISKRRLKLYRAGDVGRWLIAHGIGTGNGRNRGQAARG